MLCPYFRNDLEGGWNLREILANYHTTRKCIESFSCAPCSHRNFPGGFNESGTRDLVVASLPGYQESEKKMGACKLIPIFWYIHDNCRASSNYPPHSHLKPAGILQSSQTVLAILGPGLMAITRATWCSSSRYSPLPTYCAYSSAALLRRPCFLALQHPSLVVFNISEITLPISWASIPSS